MGRVVAALVAVGAFAAVGAVSAGAQERGVSGYFSLIMMVHTSSSSYGDLPGVNPWSGSRRNGGSFVYRSIPCTGNAPVNNISSDLPSYGTRVAGSRAPSSLRAHPFRFTVRKEDREWMIRGTMTLTVCKLDQGPTPSDDPVPDESKPKIRVAFEAKLGTRTPESTPWTGTFRLRGGTGRYEDLTGAGTIAGYLFCFAPAGCAQLGGNYLDGQLVMNGTYRDPTPELATP